MVMVNVTDPENYPKYIAANKARFRQVRREIPRARRTASKAPKARPATRHVIIEFESYETGARLLPFARIPGSVEAAPCLFEAAFRHRRRCHDVILFPAIDLKDGECVRLKLGDMSQATVYNADPAAQAQAFEDQGFEWLHVVDLRWRIRRREPQRRGRRSHPQGDEKPGAARRRHPHAWRI